MTIVRPTWSTWSFLVYAGGLTTVLALAGWTAYLARHAGRAGDFGWALLLFAVGYVLLATPLRRSSWAVLGTAGLFAATAHFAVHWIHAGVFFFPHNIRLWVPPLAFTCLGALLVALGLLSASRPAAD